MFTKLLISCFAFPADAGQLRQSSAKVSAGYQLQLQNFQNVQYMGPISVGGQTLPVIYDTGSFEILVLSTLCAKCSGGTAALYDHSKSSSYIGTQISAEHLFGSGPVASDKGFDTVRMGDMASPLVVGHMPFWQIVDHNIDVWGPNAEFSGIVGLGHTPTIPQGYGAEDSNDQTLLHSLGITSFGMCLQRGSINAPGVLSIKPILNPGLFQSMDVLGKVHWGIRMTDFSVPGVASSNPCYNGCGAIVDSGTSLIAVPPSASGLVRTLSQMVQRDCSNIHALPVLKFVLDGVTVELPPQAYVMQVTEVVAKNSSVWESMFEGPEYEETTVCQPAFMNIDKHSLLGPVYILGMPFLRYYYTVFDRSAKKIHISESTQTCQVSTTQGAFGFSNITNVSATHFAGTNQRATARSYSPSDYSAMKIDLNKARAPAWAFSKEDLVF